MNFGNRFPQSRQWLLLLSASHCGSSLKPKLSSPLHKQYPPRCIYNIALILFYQLSWCVLFPWSEYFYFFIFVYAFCLSLQQAHRRGNSRLPPPWAIVAMAVLGFNEIMTLLRYLVALCSVVLYILNNHITLLFLLSAGILFIFSCYLWVTW